jgi:hypothetical protein
MDNSNKALVQKDNDDDIVDDENLPDFRQKSVVGGQNTSASRGSK